MKFLEGRPDRWDAADATVDEIHSILEATMQQKPAFVGPSRFKIDEWSINRYLLGEPSPRRWLVDNVIPLGQAGILAAAGDTGKSMLLLDLALKVADSTRKKQDTIDLTSSMVMGGQIREHGSVVILSAEDDQDEIHRRLHALDPDGSQRMAAQGKLFVVPLPNAGGIVPLFLATSQHGIEITDRFQEIFKQLSEFQDLRLIAIDPLASFVHADVNTDPAAGAFVMGRFASLATETGATVLVAHHMSKGERSKPVASAQDARHAVRGSTALVDSSRFVYALWPVDHKSAKKISTDLAIPYRENSVVQGSIVKANSPAERILRTYIRDENTGLLHDHTARLKSSDVIEVDLEEMIVQAVRGAALDGRPFTHTGQTGIENRTEELPREFPQISRDRLRSISKKLLNENKICKATLGRSVAKWLDVPDGPFAKGVGEFADGFGQK